MKKKCNNCGNYSTNSTNYVYEELCKCCGGTGIQTSILDGLVHICPCCNGTGKKPNYNITITCSSHKKDE